MNAWDLYKMWIAQSMISYENIGDKEDTLMDIAELYFCELASRSIVQVEIQYTYDDGANRTGQYYRCKLHDVVRELCLKSGKREDFGVLSFEYHGGKLPRGITNLVHLRFLRLEECKLDKLPSSIRNLVYMDTLDLMLSENVEVPNVFKEMLRLKHLTFPVYGNEKQQYTIKKACQLIKNAIMNWKKIVVCHVSIQSSCDLTTDQMLEKALTCPNLHEFGISSKLGKLLTQCGSDLMSSKHRILDLFETEIEDDPMGILILGKLPCLIRLRLYWKSVVGEEMMCPANSFPFLKRLTLRGLPNLRKWRVEAEAMPLLSKLTIGECSFLEMIPEGLCSISILQKLVIEGMPKLRKMVLQSGQDFHKVRHVPSIRIMD
ncbi:putative disease resistance protein At1g59780 [Salvia hispanica]|uniref:putative disease resistance protein At1g59780 n=1 Tax=Salvia hispanica TaxID=49212 RepID=UPI00200968C2|nr:putative disease resistance protein At1g59780 [Salvia hispanica]